MTTPKKLDLNLPKIVYIIFAPISYYYEKFLSIKNLEKNGFEVQLCDVSNMFFSSKLQKDYFKPSMNFYNPRVKNIIKIRNFDHYKIFINSLNKDKTIIYYTGRGFYRKYDEKNYFDYIYEKKLKIFLSEFGIEFYPKDFFEYLKLKFFLVRHKFFFRKYVGLNFIGSGKNIQKIANFIYKDLNYISIPHPNFAWKKEKFQKNYTVYVEESLIGSPDSMISKVIAPEIGFNDFVQKKNINVPGIFYKKLNRFFSIFEKKYNTNVIIAASGKYFYKKNPFDKRKIIYGNTVNLINSGKYTIGHSSYALWQNLVSNKKIALLSDDLLSNYKSVEIKKFSKRSRTPINNLSFLENGEILLSNHNSIDRHKIINFFLNNSKLKKDFDQFMIDCFSNSFKSV